MSSAMFTLTIAALQVNDGFPVAKLHAVIIAGIRSGVTETVAAHELRRALTGALGGAHRGVGLVGETGGADAAAGEIGVRYTVCMFGRHGDMYCCYSDIWFDSETS